MGTPKRSSSNKWYAGTFLASFATFCFSSACLVYAQSPEEAKTDSITPDTSATISRHKPEDSIQRDLTEALIPKDSIMFSNRGYVRSRVGDLNGAMADFDTAITMDAKNIEALSGRGYLHLYKGETSAAISDFNQALAVDPKNTSALCGRGQARAHNGNEDEALEDFNLAIKLDPANAPSYIFRGYHLERRGDQPRAIADFDQTIKLDPNNALAYCYRGTAREAIKDNQGAVADFTRVIKFDPAYAWAYYRRGQARDRLGDYVNAISDFNQYMKLKPSDPWGYRARGFSRQNRGELKAAIHDYSKAIELDNADPWTFSARGFLRGKVGDLKGSISDYRKAAKLERNKTAPAAVANKTEADTKVDNSGSDTTSDTNAKEPTISLITNPSVYSLAATTLADAQKSFGPPITKIKQLLIFHRPGPHCQTMMWDADKGIFCIFMATEKFDAYFQGNLGHELLHLLNARLCDAYVEGLCSVFGEEELDDDAKRATYRALLEVTPFYKETYSMMKEIQTSISKESYGSLFRFAEYDSAKQWMHIEIDRWLDSIPATERLVVKELIAKNADAVESRMPKDGMYVFRRPSNSSQ